MKRKHICKHGMHPSWTQNISITIQAILTLLRPACSYTKHLIICRSILQPFHMLSIPKPSWQIPVMSDFVNCTSHCKQTNKSQTDTSCVSFANCFSQQTRQADPQLATSSVSFVNCFSQQTDMLIPNWPHQVSVLSTVSHSKQDMLIPNWTHHVSVLSTVSHCKQTCKSHIGYRGAQNR